MKFVYLILLLLILVSCQWNSEREILEPEVMKEVLKEMHLADSYVETLTSPLGVRSETRDEIYDIILRNNGLDRSRFYESYEYYLTHAEELNEIYQSLIDDLDSLMRNDELKKYRPDRDLLSPPDTTPPTN